MISNPGLPREKPVLSHWATDKVLHSLTHSLSQSLTHSDSPDDIVHYGLARKHKKVTNNNNKLVKATTTKTTVNWLSLSLHTQ